jgi:hypothetical protein
MTSEPGSARTSATRRTVRRVAVLVAAATIGSLVACGGDDAVETLDSQIVETSTTTTAPSTTTRPPKSTTTTTKPKPKRPVYPLTGVGKPDQLRALFPALVVKIDNAPGARPQTGFNSADLVYEEIVNDSLTRFAMVFHSRDSDPVGPVRSGRIQDIDLFGSLNSPLFAWSGGNATVTAAIRASDLREIGPSTAYRAYFRSGERRAPHNLYANTSALWAYTPPDAKPPRQQFAYRAKGDRIQGEPAFGVDVKLDSIDVRWDWDPALGQYRRTMEGSAHLDRATNTQVTTDNVVVLVMNYLNGISGSPDAQSVGFGEAFIFTGGNWVYGTWLRKNRTKAFTLQDRKGRPILLTPGRTFIELPRAGYTTPLVP